MTLFVEAWQFIVAHPERFLSALWTHIALSASALAIAVAIAVPAGVAIGFVTGNCSTVTRCPSQSCVTST